MHDLPALGCLASFRFDALFRLTMFIQFRDGGLVPKVPQGLKDRLVGNLDQAAKRPVQFQDQEERGGH